MHSAREVDCISTILFVRNVIIKIYYSSVVDLTYPGQLKILILIFKGSLENKNKNKNKAKTNKKQQQKIKTKQTNKQTKTCRTRFKF